MGERLRVDPPNVKGSVTAWDVRTVAVTFRTWIDVMTYLNAHDTPWTNLTDDERGECQLVLGTVPSGLRPADHADRLTPRQPPWVDGVQSFEFGSQPARGRSAPRGPVVALAPRRGTTGPRPHPSAAASHGN